MQGGGGVPTCSRAVPVGKELGGTSAFVVGKGRTTYEFIIPLVSLEKISGATTEHIQFNIGVSLLTWRPQWSTPEHFPESGIFALD